MRSGPSHPGYSTPEKLIVGYNLYMLQTITNKACVTPDYASVDNPESPEAPAGPRKSLWHLNSSADANQACGGPVVPITTPKKLISMIIPEMGNSPGNSGGFLQAIVLTR